MKLVTGATVYYRSCVACLWKQRVGGVARSVIITPFREQRAIAATLLVVQFHFHIRSELYRPFQYHPSITNSLIACDFHHSQNNVNDRCDSMNLFREKST